MNLEAATLAKTVWFFDYDGTVCPHQEVWELRAYDPVEIADLLTALKSQSFDVLWNTGRRPESLGAVEPRFLQFDGYFIHGSIYWNSKNKEAELLGPRLDQDIQRKVEELLTHSKTLRLEVKETGLRAAPIGSMNHKAVKKSLDALFQLNLGHEWAWHVGARGAELLARGYSKATPLETWHDTIQKNKLIPIAAGDDLFDRPALEAAVMAGGYAIVVGDTCGWITEVKHKPEQVVYCETPAQVLDLVRRMLSKV
jgi:trehalose-6-phosphatase